MILHAACTYALNGPLERQDPDLEIASVMNDVNKREVLVASDRVIERPIASSGRNVIKRHTGKTVRNTVEVLLANASDLVGGDMEDRFQLLRRKAPGDSGHDI